MAADNGDGLNKSVDALAERVVELVRQNWRLLIGCTLAIVFIAVAIEISDRQGRFDLPSGYAVRMTCEPDPESVLWNGGCERITADIVRRNTPTFIELYDAFVTVHHRRIPAPATRRRFKAVPCEVDFDLEKALRGTRYVFIPLRVHFAKVCTQGEVEAIMGELDARDRALLAIERAGLSHAALYAGALANLSEPLVLFVAAAILAALLVL